MKKILILLTFMLAATGLWAQPSASDFYISGTVTRSSDNTPIANHTVAIWEDSTNMLNQGFYTSVTTDANGFYYYVIANGSVTGPNRVFHVGALDCQNFLNTQHFDNAQGVIDAVVADFSICDFNNTCTSSFTVGPINDSTYVFTATNTGTPPLTYIWDFGDGITNMETSGIVTYMFPMPGTYNVCLTVSDANGCVSNSCQTVTFIGNPNGGCTAGFTQQANGNDSLGWVFIGNFDGQVNNQATYTWDFGDGSTGTGGPTTQHYYNTPGIYNVCVTATYNGCTATSCNTVYAGGSQGVCTAHFSTFPANVINGFYFESVNTLPSFSHFWDLGDGTTSTDSAVYHQYNLPGVSSVTICHIISNNSGCADTVCVTVTLDPDTTSPCQANFVSGPSNPNNNGDLSIDFADLSTVSGIITNWQWTFGDGTSSTQQNPSHDYATAGLYSVCLTVWNNNGCQSTYCDSVNVGNFINVGSISGFVYTDVNTPAQVAYVFLLQFDYANSELLPIDAGVVDSGFYYFANVANGDYLVKAALTPNDPLYSVRIPSYHTGAEFWFDADVITVSNSNEVDKHINMIAAVNNGGPGFIGGTVDWADTLRAAGDFAGATVIAYNANDEIVAYAIADANSNYELPALPYGTYKLLADFPGYTGNPVFVTLTPFEPSFTEVQVLLGPATVGVEETSVIGSIGVYPNPTADNATLVVETTKNAQLTLSIVNLMGQTVDVQTVNTYAGKNTVQLTTDNLAQGIYTLILRDSKGVAKAQKLIKQ